MTLTYRCEAVAMVTMESAKARDVLLTATREDGTFLSLRLGQDPGSDQLAELRLALRVLWRHWRAKDALPFEIAAAAASILHFQGECIRNLNRAGVSRPRLTEVELPDLVQGAFDLLNGVEAEQWVVRRPDLGE